MNGLNSSSDDAVECPLCMEPLEVDDINFFPCTCGYQICRFCWHRIRTDENKLCPACRKEYPENPADFKPLTQEEMIAFKSQKRQRDQQRKQKITENRKHLANVRVVQKNLVFVVGLPPRLADADILKKHEYFGKYGKIHKVVINPSTTYAGVQGPSASAYVTYVHNADALRAIQSVNNIMIDGRLIKTSLGTTKYCSHFMKNQQCPKGDCMYLHELGDPEASFTKEEMHQGKHQEYEKRLHDALIASAGAANATAMGSSSTSTSGSSTNGNVTVPVPNGSSSNSKTIASSSLASMSSSSTSSSSTTSTTSSSCTNGAAAAAGGGGAAAGNGQQKEAWPSLSVSPVNSKESSSSSSGNNSSGKNKKDKTRNEKSRHEKTTNKGKSKNSSGSGGGGGGQHSSNSGSSSSSNKENFHTDTKDNNNSSSNTTPADISKRDETTVSSNNNNRSRGERNNKDKSSRKEQQQQISKESSAAAKQQQQHHRETPTSLANSQQIVDETPAAALGVADISESSDGRGSPIRPNSNAQRSLSSSSDDASDDPIFESSTSGKSSPETQCNSGLDTATTATTDITEVALSPLDSVNSHDVQQQPEMAMTEVDSTHSSSNSSSSSSRELNRTPIGGGGGGDLDTSSRVDNSNSIDNSTAALAKLNLFDDSNSFFSSSPAFQQSLLLKKKLEAEMRQNQMNNSAVSSHLPDLLNGIDGYQKTANTNEWEEAFKNVMMCNRRHVEEQLLHQQHLQQQQQHHHQQVLQQQEEFLRMHEMQKRNNAMNNIGLSQMNGPQSDFPSNFHGNSALDMTRAQAEVLLQQQQQQQQQQQHLLHHPSAGGGGGGDLFGGGNNMSKFFDFHKSQQQQLQHHQYLNGHSPQTNMSGAGDPHRLANYLDRASSQFVDNGVVGPQSQVQKQRLLGMFETMSQNQSQGSQQQQQQQQQPQSQQSRFSQNSIADDDLGFDPFIETQKGLAELMENEVVQQQNIGTKLQQQQQQQQAQQQASISQHQQMLDNMQRARMPPPGFNHMNTVGFGGMNRVQQQQQQQNSSKILPFMNMSSNGGGGGGGGGIGNTQMGQLQMPPMAAANWNPHMAGLHPGHQGGQSMTDTQLQHQLAQAAAAAAAAAAGTHNKGYSSNDWTSMDPAILSFRQFSSFPQGQMPPHPQQQQDMFLQHLAQQQQQQQQQQNSQGFNQNQLLGGMNMPNNLLNAQQSTQPQVNANVQGMLEFLKNRQFV